MKSLFCSPFYCRSHHPFLRWIGKEDQQYSWYKCTRGHIYAIGSCGEPNQVSKCPCGSEIGGTSKEGLVKGNRHIYEHKFKEKVLVENGSGA